jgi:subtilisin family serine protease
MRLLSPSGNLRPSSRTVRTCLVVLAAAAVGTFLAAGIGAADGSQARLLVKFAPGASTQARATALGNVDASELRAIPDIGVQVVAVPSTTAADSLAGLKKSPGVEFAEPDAVLQPQDQLPSDPAFPQSFAVGGGAWGWYKTHTTQAWDITKGDPSVIVAILDTGLKTQGLDDYNGQVVTGWNVLNNSTDTSSMAGNHGTYVAGVVGLAGNNGIGNDGFCPGCKVMPVQVGTDSGASDSAIATGITWAADHGARVENLSWAGTGDSQTLQNAINYAHSKGLVITAAAGNTNCDCKNYPAADQNVLGVAGTNTTDNKQGDSNYGSWVAIAAPEGNMTSWPSISGAPGYSPVGGTSLAAPVVAGIAGLLFSANPGLTNTQVEQALEQTAAPVNFSVASGRVDALAALNSLGFSDPQASSPPVNGVAPRIYLETNGDSNYTPLVTSTPQPGQVLLRGQGSWTGSAPLSLSAVKWLRCDTSGANCTTVSTTAKYTVQSADAGYTFKLQITVANNLGQTTLTSALSQPVGGSAPPPAPPVNTASPVVSGTAQDGRTLQSTNGTWSNSPTGYAYQWLRCDTNGANCASIAGATSSSYLLTSGDVGSTVRSQVTATNSAGSASAQSTRTAVVAAAPPVNTAPPAESGPPSQGQTLTTSNGSWSGTTPMSDGYQWLRCDALGGNCSAIAGATGSSYTLASADVGSTVRSQVTAANSAGQASAQSGQTAVVTNLKTFTFTGMLTNKLPSMSFPVTIGAGEADATLTFSKSATMTVQLVNPAGTVVGQVSDTKPPLALNLPGLAAGPYTYVVSGSGYKGSVSFTLTVLAPGP